MEDLFQTFKELKNDPVVKKLTEVLQITEGMLVCTRPQIKNCIVYGNHVYRHYAIALTARGFRNVVLEDPGTQGRYVERSFPFNRLLNSGIKCALRAGTTAEVIEKMIYEAADQYTSSEISLGSPSLTSST
jgi:hypothetical protein